MASPKTDTMQYMVLFSHLKKTNFFKTRGIYSSQKLDVLPDPLYLILIFQYTFPSWYSLTWSFWSISLLSNWWWCARTLLLLFVWLIDRWMIDWMINNWLIINDWFIIKLSDQWPKIDWLTDQWSMIAWLSDQWSKIDWLTD